MANMSYCRFENTLSDIIDCNNNMDKDGLSDEELRARKRLIETCIEIALDWGQEVGREVVEAK